MGSSARVFSFLLLATSLVNAGPVAHPRASQPTATVASGVVVGTTTQYPGATATANKFLGIPYAKSPPVRFGLPEPAAKWNTPLAATSYKPICFQQGNGTTANGTLAPQVQSEDCLYANVFTPPGTTSSSGKTVMLWIFGGNLQYGDGSEPMYDGSLLAANNDVIVVTFNYRLNVFGFSNAPEIPVSQRNAGFYDQRFALQWVKTNIAAFGGDPNKITLFGWSAGAQSIRNLIALPPSPQVYRAAIMESEATGIFADGTVSWTRLAAALGCPTGTGSLACVRAADAKAVQSVVVGQSLGFPQTADNVTFVDDAGIAASFSGGRAAPVPILIGTNGQELSSIAHRLGLDGAPASSFYQVIEAFQPKLGARLANETQKALGTNAAYVLATQFFTQLVFQCPAATLAGQARDRGSSVWRYYYNASFPNTEIFPGAGAYHGSELTEVFGTYPRKPPAAIAPTQQQIDLSAFMRGAWSAFAKNPPSGPGWPLYGTDGQVGDLGANGSTGERTIPASSIDTLCGVFDLVGGIGAVLQGVNQSSPAAQSF